MKRSFLLNPSVVLYLKNIAIRYFPSEPYLRVLDMSTYIYFLVQFDVKCFLEDHFKNIFVLNMV